MQINLDPVIDEFSKWAYPPAEKVILAAFCIAGGVLGGGYWQAFVGDDLWMSK